MRTVSEKRANQGRPYVWFETGNYGSGADLGDHTLIDAVYRNQGIATRKGNGPAEASRLGASRATLLRGVEEPDPIATDAPHGLTKPICIVGRYAAHS